MFTVRLANSNLCSGAVDSPDATLQFLTLPSVFSRVELFPPLLNLIKCTSFVLKRNLLVPSHISEPFVRLIPLFVLAPYRSSAMPAFHSSSSPSDVSIEISCPNKLVPSWYSSHYVIFMVPKQILVFLAATLVWCIR